MTGATAGGLTIGSTASEDFGPSPGARREPGASGEQQRAAASGEQLSGHFLRLDPLWNPIRDHPRFKALLAKRRS